MRNFLSTIYKYHSLFYKVSLFVASTLFIVYLFPKGGGFKYDFEKGKVWQNENLYAPFDFAIQKTTKQVLDEEKLLKNNIPLYFTLDTIAPVTSYNKLIKEFKSTFPDSLGDKFKLTSEVKLRKVFSKIYKIGLLSEDFIIDSRREVFLRKKGSKEAKKYFFSELLATEDVDKLLKTNFSDSIFTSYNNYYTTLFYNNLKPNIAFDKEFSDRVYLQEKSKILPTIGLVKKNGIVISVHLHPTNF